jgi:hypothetical protein
LLPKSPTLSPVCATSARPQLVPFSPSPPQAAAAAQAVLAVVGAVAVESPAVVEAVVVLKSAGSS